MPTFTTGNMWDAYPTADRFVITTNSFITPDGRLVMGRGIARAARDRFPGLDRRLATAIRERGGHLGTYYLAIDPLTKIIAFQVKHHWNDPANTSLIQGSANALTRLINGHPLNIHLNFPGIGNGHLTRAAVLPYLYDLPPNVTIWEKDS